MGNVMIRHTRATALLVALLTLSGIATGCATGGPRLEGLDADALFAVGQEAMREEDWDNAVLAFQRFTLQFPTHARGQEARYLLGLAHMGDRQYITAANEFSRLASDFPAGPWADDARFNVCESYYELSPHPQLDQEYTRGAVDHCQSLISYYPDSEYVGRAQAMLDELRTKLAQKLFLTGEFYYKRGAHDSAILYYDATVARYPTTAVAPRALVRLLDVYEELGYTPEAEATRQRLLTEYPESPEAAALRGPSAPA
jgi:outer membrane protein assembly factor BamD